MASLPSSQTMAFRSRMTHPCLPPSSPSALMTARCVSLSVMAANSLPWASTRASPTLLWSRPYGRVRASSHPFLSSCIPVQARTLKCTPWPLQEVEGVKSTQLSPACMGNADALRGIKSSNPHPVRMLDVHLNGPCMRREAWYQCTSRSLHSPQGEPDRGCTGASACSVQAMVLKGMLWALHAEGGNIMSRHALARSLQGCTALG